MDLSLLQHSGDDAYADILPPLHRDNVNEILLRLSAKDLCRLRAVSRSWRSILSNPQFIAAHAAHHPAEPLIVLGYKTYNPKDRKIYDICDLSGHIVKEVHVTGDRCMVYARPDLLCAAEWANMSVKLLIPATGVDVHALPKGLAEEHAAYEQNRHMYSFTATFGQVASTGVYKVFRVFAVYDNGGHPEHLCEVFTLDGSYDGKWRAKQAPPYQVEIDHWDNVVISGIVYFLLYNVDEDNLRIGSFNLETEEWSPSIPGPLSSAMGDNAGVLDAHHMNRPFRITIGALSGNLVIACHPATITASSMDLWFLVDFEVGQWVKQYSIKLSVTYLTFSIHPLLVLNDGRIVFVTDTISKGRVLSIYNSETKTSQDVMELRYGAAVGLYTGSVLSLANSAIPVSEVSILFSTINMTYLISLSMEIYNLVPLSVLSYRTQLHLLMVHEIYGMC
jgi:F-box interacting protein